MARIKSALELALERTEGVKSDKETLKADSMKKEGKKLASEYLQAPTNGESVDLSKRLKEFSGKELDWVKEGLSQVFLANLTLPLDETYSQKFDNLSKGILELVKDKKNAAYILKQIGQFFTQYMDNQKQLAQNLEKQYAPKLRQKEAELARQMGADIHLSPQSDPEFMGILKNQFAQLETRYQEALSDVKGELEKMLKDSV